ncbi:MAG: serine hydrolase [Gemmataceae bacterium]|nr:serine hydrolase [Gemmataceae bacterium]
MSRLGFSATLLFMPLLLADRAMGQSPPPAQIDIIVKEALKFWKAPGLAIAIVYDGRIAYLQGYGVRELGKADAVTADTVFPLASCSKPLTATLLAMLVDDRTLNWDDPVRKHLPWFKLADPLADRNVTVRDLLCHRTGLGKHDALWYRSPLPMEERVRRLAFLELSHPFRTTFEYQAVAFGAAGLAGAAAAKSTWHDLIRQRLFVPLEMRSASPVFPGPAPANCASPHRRNASGSIEVIDRYPLDQPDPAGSIHASARDLAKFLRLQLDDGLWQGKPLVSRDNLRETHEPHSLIRGDDFIRALNPFSHVFTYGLGWFGQDYRGRWVLLHGGQIAGFRAQLTLVPEARLGIALLNNLDRTWMNFALSNTLVDRFCQLPAKDWNEHCFALAQLSERLEEARVKKLYADRRDIKPSVPLAAYVGTYADPAYGSCIISLEKDRLHWQWHNLRSPLEHFEADTFSGTAEPVDHFLFTFVVNDQGQVTGLRAMDRLFHRQR